MKPATSFGPACGPVFPKTIVPKQVLTEQDIALLAEATLHPVGVVAPQFPPRHWLPTNERLAFALGSAQQALRDLDDQRAVALRAEIGQHGVLIRLQRAPHPETVRAVHSVRSAQEQLTRALFGEPHCEVLLEWPE